MELSRERHLSEALVIRVFISVRDPGRRAFVRRSLRANPDVLFVAREEDADLLVTDADSRAELAGSATSRALLGIMGTEARVEDVSSDDGSLALSPRERDVLLLVAAGMGNTDIGVRLGISRSTVKYHLGSVFEKLGVHSRAEAVATGIRKGIVLV